MAFNVLEQAIHVVKISCDVVVARAHMMTVVAVLAMHFIVDVFGVSHHLIHFTVGIPIPRHVVIVVVHFPTYIFRFLIHLARQCNHVRPSAETIRRLRVAELHIIVPVIVAVAVVVVAVAAAVLRVGIRTNRQADAAQQGGQ